MQINLHYCEDANEALFSYCDKYSVDIILAQNPYIYNGTLVGVPSDWPFFLSDNNNAVIFLTNSDFVCINKMALDNSVLITLNANSTVLFIGSQYSAPSGDIGSDMVAFSGLQQNSH